MKRDKRPRQELRLAPVGDGSGGGSSEAIPPGALPSKTSNPLVDGEKEDINRRPTPKRSDTTRLCTVAGVALKTKLVD